MKKKQKLNRRDFLKLSSIASASLPIAMSGYPVFANELTSNYTSEEDNDKILVIVQLDGGNDGLNTFYNLDQYDNLQKVRSNIIVPKDKLLKINKKDNEAFHPAISGLKEVWDQEKLTVIQNVGYPNSNGSHFRSKDIWTSASDHDQIITSGWLGRYLAINAPDFPENYPNETNPHPFALTIGKVVSETCQGPITNFGMVIHSPGNPTDIDISETDNDFYKSCYGDKVGYVDSIINQTKNYTSVIKEAFDKGNTLSKKYGRTNDNQPAGKLRNIAKLISGGLQTKIYAINLPGWDHHANQVESKDRTKGSQAMRLQGMSDAIAAFQDDLKLLGLEDRVIGLVFSEFGRRIKSNGSMGTDHGSAGPVIMFGKCANNQFIGDAPVIDPNVGSRDNLPFHFDFRRVYSTVLQDWLGVTKKDTESVLFKNFDKLPLFKAGCISSNSSALSIGDSEIFDVEIFPNPVVDMLNIQFMGENKTIRMRLFDTRGYVVKNITFKKYSAQKHQLSINIQDLPTGTYILHYMSGNVSKTKKVIKM